MVKNVAIVSLSRGTIGEAFVKHELDLGVERLKSMGLNVRFMPHALKGIDHLEKHPEQRAADCCRIFLKIMNCPLWFLIRYFSAFPIRR